MVSWVLLRFAWIWHCGNSNKMMYAAEIGIAQVNEIERFDGKISLSVPFETETKSIFILIHVFDKLNQNGLCHCVPSFSKHVGEVF